MRNQLFILMVMLFGLSSSAWGQAAMAPALQPGCREMREELKLQLRQGMVRSIPLVALIDPGTPGLHLEVEGIRNLDFLWPQGLRRYGNASRRRRPTWARTQRAGLTPQSARILEDLGLDPVLDLRDQFEDLRNQLTRFFFHSGGMMIRWNAQVKSERDFSVQFNILSLPTLQDR